MMPLILTTQICKSLGRAVQSSFFSFLADERIVAVAAGEAGGSGGSGEKSRVIKVVVVASGSPSDND
jgi:hypothetical protein